MSWVPAAHLTTSRRPRARGRARAGHRVGLLGLAIVVAAALSISDRSPAPRSPARPAFSGLIGGVPLQLARCSHWRSAPPAERQGAVAALAQAVGGRSTTGGYGTTLDASAATALFDRHCAAPAESSVLLYEIYIRAAAFQ